MSDQKKNNQRTTRTTRAAKPKQATAAALQLEDTEEELAEDPATPEPEPAKVAADYEIPTPQDSSEGAPAWVNLPGDFRFPRGRQVLFVRFRAALTDTPWKGERQAILWPISVGDKKMALQRSQGDANRFSDEVAKQMIRACDGHKVDWSGNPGPGNVDVFWEEIGERGRTMLQRMFVQLHVPNREEMRDFFENCIASRVTG